MVKIGNKTISHIYQGGNLIVSDSNNTKEIRLGDKSVNFVFQGNELLYPNPIKDGLVLWYDFKSMKNNDISKSVARDLSGSGNNGMLQNFAYTSESGYNNGLKFDNVDDMISLDVPMGKIFTLSMTIEVNLDIPVQFFCGSNYAMFYIRKSSNDLHVSIPVEGADGVVKQITTNGGNAFFSKLSNSNKTKFQVSITVDGDKKELSLYGNEELLTNRSFEEDIKFANLTKLGYWVSSNNLDGKIFSTQLYNRVLSDTEIQHNYQLEKERWEL